MTPEQLAAIEKLARDPKSAAFHDLMARQTIPLVKALREARELAESNMTTIVNLNTAMHLQAVEIDSYHRKRMASVEKERDEARAEVERLREVMRQVHALVSTVRATAVLDDIEKLREIHKITKGTSDAG